VPQVDNLTPVELADLLPAHHACPVHGTLYKPGAMWGVWFGVGVGGEVQLEA
jgi:hypothetical protein